MRRPVELREGETWVWSPGTVSHDEEVVVLVLQWLDPTSARCLTLYDSHPAGADEVDAWKSDIGVWKRIA